MNEQQTLRSLIDAWFRKQGFKQVRFEGPTERITTYNMEHTLVYKLHNRPDHDTFYNPDYAVENLNGGCRSST